MSACAVMRVQIANSSADRAPLRSSWDAYQLDLHAPGNCVEVLKISRVYSKTSTAEIEPMFVEKSPSCIGPITIDLVNRQQRSLQLVGVETSVISRLS